MEATRKLRTASLLLLLTPLSQALASEPQIEHLELHMRLDPPGGFQARVRVEVSGLETDRLGLLLNKELRVASARDGAGESVGVQHGWRNPFGRFHREGRTVLFQLGSIPADGKAVLEIEYGGVGESGTKGSDWRGILFVDTDQVRMSEQTIFYPQIALGGDGPRIQRSTAEVWVDAPEDLEVFVPGELTERSAGVESGRTRWHFSCMRPTVLSVLAGRLERHEIRSGRGRVTLLLRPEHAGLAGELAREAEASMRFYRDQFGDLAADEPGLDHLGIVEIDCRDGTSINWASQGVATFDRGAFGNGVPVASVAHEVAHLWWGQGVGASGPGERFLTESLAEYSAWRYLRTHPDRELEGVAVERAHERYRNAADRGHDRALAHVTFATPGYSALAYSKGPLVLRLLEQSLGTAALDRGIAAYARTDGEPGIEDFLASLSAAEPSRSVQVEWFHEDGHPGFELVGVQRDGSGIVRGEVVTRDWFAGHDPTGEVTLELSLEGGRKQRSVLRLMGERTPFEIQSEGVALGLELDPDRHWPAWTRVEQVLEGVNLVASQPEQGCRDVPSGTRELVLRFDREMAVPELKALARAQYGDGRWGPVVIDCEVDGDTVKLVTSPLRPGEEYSIKLGRLLSDRRGAPLLTETLEFSTAPSGDEESPRVVDCSIEVGAKDVPTDVGQVSFTMNEAMDASRGFKTTVLARLKAEGLEFPPFDGMDWDPSYRVLTCRLEELAPATRYVIPLRGVLFHDLSGNRLEDFDLTFETATD